VDRPSRQEKQSPSSTLLAGLAQPFHYVGVVARSKPRRALAYMHVERGRRDRDGFFEGRLRCLDATKLAEGRREPAVGRGKVGI